MLSSRPCDAAQVVLAAQGETSTAVHVFRPDHWAPGSAAAPRGAAGSSSATGGGTMTAGSASSGVSEAEERLELRDWVVGGQVRMHERLGYGLQHAWCNICGES